MKAFRIYPDWQWPEVYSPTKYGNSQSNLIDIENLHGVVVPEGMEGMNEILLGEGEIYLDTEHNRHKTLVRFK